MRVSSRRTQVTRGAFLSTTLLARTNDKRASFETGCRAACDLSSRSAPARAATLFLSTGRTLTPIVLAPNDAPTTRGRCSLFHYPSEPRLAL